MNTRNRAGTWAALFAVMLLLAGCEGMHDDDANQPVLSQESIADPHVIRHDGRYYLYGTSVPADHYDVFVSDDGLNWYKAQTVFAKDSELLWAPAVFHDPVSERFFLYYSLDFNVGVAVADTPTGPFVDEGILIEDAIDAFMYFEEGKYFLYYSTADLGIQSLEEMGEHIVAGLFGDDGDMLSTNVYVQAMSSPRTLAGEPQLLLQPTVPWEQGFSLYVNEAPWLFKEKDTYYLMYSGSATHESNYAIGYATADNPLGPFRKSPDNPLLYGTPDPGVFGKTVYGPGHNSVVEDAAGARWIYFHQNTRRFNLGMGSRYTTRGALLIDADGKLEVRLRTTPPQ